MDDQQLEEEIDLDTPASGVFIAPSINSSLLFQGSSYKYFSPVPPTLLPKQETSESPHDPTLDDGPECILGVDEAGRGPVLGPMVYGLFYLPRELSNNLLRETHHFDDSKVLTPAVRSSLMEKLCTTATDLHENCGWAVDVMSPRDIGSNMMKPGAIYNLNSQAMDATIALIQGVYERGVNVKEIYIDTIGRPETYQKKLERIFPTAKVTVAKKADSIYPCVSAASVCAKVTRDAALETLGQAYFDTKEGGDAGWGSGYPSDARCVGWMKMNMNPIFGWGSECRFSWGTAKDMLDSKATSAKVDWPAEQDEDTVRLTDFFNVDRRDDSETLGTWFGSPASIDVI